MAPAASGETSWIKGVPRRSLALPLGYDDGPDQTALLESIHESSALKHTPNEEDWEAALEANVVSPIVDGQIVQIGGSFTSV